MNQKLINELKKELEIACQKEEARIIELIQKTIKELHKDGAVIGLSGGLDSSMCAYLLTKALGKDKVLAVLSPERDSSRVNHEHTSLSNCPFALAAPVGCGVFMHVWRLPATSGLPLMTPS